MFMLNIYVVLLSYLCLHMNDIRAIFDIGNDTIKAVVFWKDNEKDVILAKQIEPVMWMRKWKILQAEDFTNVINKIVEYFIKKLGGDFIDKVYVGISHPEMRTKRLIEWKRIMNEAVEMEDLNHLSRIVAEIADENNYETIKIVPVARILDETKREKDPIWLKCKKLELMADIFMIPKNFYNGLIDAFDKIGLVVADIIPNILAASEVAVDYDHKDLGTVMVDIGKNQTSYVIYEDWYPIGYWTLPIGWEEVTKDISIWMQVDIKEAEDIKKSNWSCIIDSETPQDLPLDTHFLTEIISARYEQIFGKINNHLIKLEKDWRLPWGILLLWWWAKIKYIDILAKEVFKLATFYAKDQVINIGDLSNNIQFLNIIGCYYWSLKYVEEWRHGWWGINFWKTMWKIWKFFKDLF